MKFKTAAFAVACLASINTQAGIIENGDFETGDFSGWNLDTDGSVGTNEFSIDDNGANKRAAITIDSAGPDAFFNTLYQALDFTGTVDSIFQLSFDFGVSTQSTSTDMLDLDFFSASLYDGTDHYNADALQHSFLISDIQESAGHNGIIDGSRSASLTFNLDSSFTNTTGWLLDFTLNSATGFDASTLYIDNVSLRDLSAQVPEPTTLAIFTLGLAGLLARKKHVK